jgi:hypothetical protein
MDPVGVTPELKPGRNSSVPESGVFFCFLCLVGLLFFFMFAYLFLLIDSFGFVVVSFVIVGFLFFLFLLSFFSLFLYYQLHNYHPLIPTLTPFTLLW